MPLRPENQTTGATTALEQAVNRSRVVHYLADPRDGFQPTYVSGNVESVLGYSVADFLRHSDFRLDQIHPVDRHEFKSVLNRALLQGSAAWEFRLLTGMGELRWFREELEAICDDVDGRTLIVGCLIEVTDSKQAAEEPERRCGVLNATLDTIPDGIALFDKEDRLAFCNAGFAALQETAADALVGLTGPEVLRRLEKICIRVRDWTGEERFGPRIRELKRIQRPSETKFFEMEVADGRWFLATAHHMPDGCTTLVCTDITEHKRFESSLHDTEALKAGIIDSAMDCIMAIDEQGRIIEFNPAAEQTFGYSRAGAIGQPIGELILPEGLRKVDEDGIPLIFRNEDELLPGSRIEFKAMRADGSRFPAEVTVSRVELAGRRVFAVSLRDINEHKRARKERKRLIQLLRDAIESVPSGFGIYDSAGLLVLCNTAYASFYNELPEAMIGLSKDEAHHRVLDLVRSVDGEPVGVDADSRERTLALLEQWVERPIEIELKSGQWNLFTGHRTSDGGIVCVRIDISKLKEAEASLRERADFFRSMVETQPAPVWMVEIDSGQILHESRAAAELFGIPWPIKEPVSVIDLYVDLEDRTKLLNDLRATGAVDNREMQLKKTDGTAFWISATCRLLEIEGRDVVIASMLDLTERKRREAELQQAKQTLEDAIGSLSEGFALYDTDDRLVMCNQRYREYNSASADMLKPGVRWADFVRAGAERGQYVPALGRVEEWIEERQAQRASHARHVHIEQSDGRWFQVSNQPTRQGGYVAIRTDITHLKQMEIALRKSEERFRRMVEEHPLPVLMTRAKDGKIVYESPATKALFGREEEQPEPEGMHDVPVGYYADPKVREGYLALLYRDGLAENYEMEFKKVDGTRFWASVSSRLIEYHGEDVIVASLVDLTERRKAEEELARRREALHQSEKLSALGSLLAGVAHELNNPLSIVVGQALLLRETVADPKIAKRASKIGDAADRCSRIVRAFLAMARQRPPQRSEVNLNFLLDAVLEMLGYSLRTQNIELRIDQDSALPSVWADSDQLNQVLVNLIVNAQQAVLEREEPRIIEVATRYDRQKGAVRVLISDNGPGIPKEIRSRIFDPFFTTKEVGAGTGVGLAVSHGIIESHGGTIDVESGAEQGATFTITLPQSTPERIDIADAGEDQSQVVGARVLIVDDEKEIAQTLSEILVADGHRIEFADSGREALALLDRRDYDAVLCDLRMPDLDGQGLYRQLEERQHHVLGRFIFVTGDTFGHNASEFFKETGLPYLEKPFTPVEVRSLVRRVVAGERRAP